MFMKPRRSMRLAGYDYHTAGAYAITILSMKRMHLFEIPKLRTILEEEWINLPQHFIGCSPDVMVVMPDHIHCILFLEKDVEGITSAVDMIGGYKSLASRAWLNYLEKSQLSYPGKIWHRRFYDHIIRNEADLRAQKSYILNNPIVAKLKKEQQNYILHK